MKALDKIQEHKRRISQEEPLQEPNPQGVQETAATEHTGTPESPGTLAQPVAYSREEAIPEKEAGPPASEPEQTPESFTETTEPDTGPPDTGDEEVAADTGIMDTGSADQVIAPHDMHADTLVLLKYALGTGKRMPEKIKELLRQDTLNNVIQVYQELSLLIRPAIPGSVLYLEEQRSKYRHLKFLGSVPIVCYLMLVGIISFLTLVFSSCSPMVNEANLAHGLLNSSGLDLLVNLLFISSVSCLGSVFSLLPKINEQIRQATYLPGSDMYYWSTLMLGIFGGLIMGELLCLNYDIPGTPVKFDTIVFALMGGFASESVFLILKSIMAKIQQLVAGEAREDIH